MSQPSDICFAGSREVILLNWEDEFVRYPVCHNGVTTYIAGSFCENIDPVSLVSEKVSGLFGQFVLVRHDRNSRKLIVITDRFGLFPLYIGRVDRRIYLSTDFYDLARRCKLKSSPDFGAMSDLLAFDVPFDQRTTLTAVTSFTGSTETIIDLDTLTVSSRKLWDPVRLLSHADLRFDQVKDELVDLFLEGVKLATANHATASVTLSGGADSRCLLGASLHISMPTRTYSTGVPGSRALSYARRMAELSRVPSTISPLDERFVAGLGPRMQECSDAIQRMSFSSELEATWLRQSVASNGVLLHGGFAELYKIGKMHRYHLDRKLTSLHGEAVSEHLWQRFAKSYEQRRSCFAPAYRTALGNQSHEHLAEKVARYQSQLDTPGVLQMLYIDEFLGKVVKSSWQMWRQRIPTMFPFAYPPLVDLILRVRGCDKIGTDFVVHLLKRTNKDLARFPDSNTGVPIGASRARREVAHVIDYVTRCLFSSKRGFDHQDFSQWLSSVPLNLTDLFDSFQAESDAFDIPRVRELIRCCHAGDDMAARTLHVLWAWSLMNQESHDKSGAKSVRKAANSISSTPGTVSDLANVAVEA